MRASLLLAALAVATSANALCLTDAECPRAPCAAGVCVGGRCGLDPSVRRGAVCRGSAGVCDIPEVCDGVLPTCPPDIMAPSTKECRPSAGLCDVAEFCTGASAACPADLMVPAGTLCRAAEGACDVPETCDGAHSACPADALASASTVCRPAANDCDAAETCTGQSKDCPGDSNAPPGTACENASACIFGGTCAGPICFGGTPELTFAPDPGELPKDAREVTVTIKHTSAGARAPITLTDARIDPPGAFEIATAPQWPVSLPSGAEQKLTVRLAAGAAPGDYTATLLVQAASCADQPLHLHAAVASPAPDAGPGTPDAGPATPDAGSATPDAGSATPDAGSGNAGAVSSGAPAQAQASGGCSSSGGAQPQMLALVALAALGARRRSRLARA